MGDSIGQCSVCLADIFRSSPPGCLKCGHVFHLACLKQSLQHVSGVCPLCRKRDKHTIRLYFDGDADSRRLSTASGSQSLANASSRMVTELNTKVDSLSRRLDEAHSFRLREEKLATELKLQLHASLAVGQSCRETIERQKRTVDGLEKEKDALQVISNELRSLVRRTRGEKKELEDELSNLRENYCTLNATRRLEKRKNQAVLAKNDKEMSRLRTENELLRRQLGTVPIRSSCLSERQDQLDQPRSHSESSPERRSALRFDLSPSPRRRTHQSKEIHMPRECEDLISDDSDLIIIPPTHHSASISDHEGISHPRDTSSSSIEEILDPEITFISSRPSKRSAHELEEGSSRKVKAKSSVVSDITLGFRGGKSSIPYSTGPRHKVKYRRP